MKWGIPQRRVDGTGLTLRDTPLAARLSDLITERHNGIADPHRSVAEDVCSETAPAHECTQNAGG